MIRAIAALWAAMAIGAGAFGAHGAEGQAEQWLQTGASYQLAHAIAALALADRRAPQVWALVLGSGLFAGSLYLLAIGAPRGLAALAPLGGATMIMGWLWIALAEFKASAR